MTTTKPTTVLDRIQQQLDHLGNLIEASRRDPESVGGPDAPADAQNISDWIAGTGTGQRFRCFDLGTAVLHAEHGVEIEVSLHGEQHDDGTTERWAAVNGGDGMNAEDTRKLAHLLMQVANKMDAATDTPEPEFDVSWSTDEHGGQWRGFDYPKRTVNDALDVRAHGVQNRDGTYEDLAVTIDVNGYYVVVADRDIPALVDALLAAHVELAAVQTTCEPQRASQV